MSCKNSVDSLGLSIPPCRTTYSLFNMSLYASPILHGMHSALENMLFITFSKLPYISLFNDL